MQVLTTLVASSDELKSIPEGSFVPVMRGKDVQHMVCYEAGHDKIELIEQTKAEEDQNNVRGLVISKPHIAIRMGVVTPLAHPTQYFRLYREGQEGHAERKKFLEVRGLWH